MITTLQNAKAKLQLNVPALGYAAVSYTHLDVYKRQGYYTP